MKAPHEQFLPRRTNDISPPHARPDGRRAARRSDERIAKSGRQAVCWRVARWLALRSTAFCVTVASAQALDPDLPPSGNFDLSHWKLTLPDSNATEVAVIELQAGFTNGYFYTGPDGAMTFWCPVNGGTTDGSTYPRSELRELLDPGNENVNWPGYGTNTLDAQCQVTKIPSTKKVIIGQIHSFTGNAFSLAKLQFNDGQVEALVRRSPDSLVETNFSFGTIGLNNLITYQLKLEEGWLSMTVNGSNHFLNIFESDPAWTNQTFYFKAGSYCQDNTGPVTEGALVAFYQLRVEHQLPQIPAPAISITDWRIHAGRFSFTLVGQGGGSYFIQTSTDLTHWNYLLVTNSISGRVGFTEALRPGVHFYRGGSF